LSREDNKAICILKNRSEKSSPTDKISGVPQVKEVVDFRKIVYQDRLFKSMKEENEN
jgi:hypothetical protein